MKDKWFSFPPALRTCLRTVKSEWGKIGVLCGIGTIRALLSVRFSLICRELVDGAVARNADEVVKAGIAALVVVVLLMLLHTISVRLSDRESELTTNQLRNRFFETCLKKQYSGVSAWHSGEIMNRMTADVQTVSDGAVNILPELTTFAVQMLGAVVILIGYDALFTVILLLGTGVVLLVCKLFSRRMKRFYSETQASEGRVRAVFQETLSSLLVVKAFHAESVFLDRSAKQQKQHADLRKKKTRYSAGVQLIFSSVMNGGYLFGLLWSGYGLLHGTISFGTLTAVQQLISKIQNPLSGLGGMVGRYSAMLAASERLTEPETLPDEPHTLSENARLSLRTGFSEIRVKALSFSYPDGAVRRLVLDRLNLCVRAGEFTALTGQSGIGKSTLFKLLLSVYPPDSGTLSVLCGGDEYAVSCDTRLLFAYVPQGNYLFSGTVRENLTMIRPDASEEEITLAVRTACAEEFLTKLPDGYETVIGERGMGLSEGQMQRIAIARALLSGAPVLLLDEATSALDEETELALLQNLRALKNKTCFLVTHRPAALKFCDCQINLHPGGKVTVNTASEN